MTWILLPAIGLLLIICSIVYACVAYDGYDFWSMGSLLTFMVGILFIITGIVFYLGIGYLGLASKPQLLTVYDVNGYVRFQEEGDVSTIDSPNLRVYGKDGTVYNIKLKDGESYRVSDCENQPSSKEVVTNNNTVVINGEGKEYSIQLNGDGESTLTKKEIS